MTAIIFKHPLKVTGDNLLIHEFAYSLFVSLFLVTSNMTGYSHSYHSIKLIHCSAPQKDVSSDKMVLLVVTHSFYFMLCQSSLLNTVISFVYLYICLYKWWFAESMSVIFSRREIFKSVDHVKYEGQVRSQHLLFVQSSR